MKFGLLTALALGDSPTQGLFQRLMFNSIAKTKGPRPTTHREFQYSYLSKFNLRLPEPNETFDYIVVGGGGAGCPLARTLADAGYKTLLVERGGLREEYPVTWDLHGSGAALMDSRVSQPVVTKQGHITHIGHVLGGGTSVNLGFYIEGNDEEFTSQFKYKALWRSATRWIRHRVAHATRKKMSYYDSLTQFASELTGNVTLGLSPEYVYEANWEGMSIYNPNDDFRMSADTLLGPINEFPQSLILSTDTLVTKLHTERDPNTRLLLARCIEIQPSEGQSKALLGRRESVVGALQNEATVKAWFDWYPNISNFVSNLFTPPSSTKSSQTVCLNNHPKSEIILSAGAILTPALMLESGLGPVSETTKLGVSNKLNLIHLGHHLGDRVFLPIAFFFKKHITDMFKPAIVQRIALWTSNAKFRPESTLQSEAHPEDESRGVEQKSQTRMAELEELLAFTAPSNSSFSASNATTEDEASLSWLEISQNVNSEEGKLGGDPIRQAAPLDDSYLAGFEEVSGGMMTTGCGVSTRYFFPPKLRSSIAVDVALETLFGCTQHKSQTSPSILSLCPLVKPILDCFQKTAALIYLLPEPKSRGRITIGGPDGRTVEVDGAYFTDPEDLRAGTAGLADLLQKIDETTAFDKSFEFTTDIGDQCPALMRDTLASLFFRLTNMLVPYIGLQEAQVAVQSLESLFAESGENALDSLGLPSERIEGATVDFREALEYKYASFPPIVPDPWDYEKVKQLLWRQSTSMWHWHGSASIGKVVNDNLHVAGTQHLSIADASVVPTLPKMNPQVAIMTLGRYAGLIKLAARGRLSGLASAPDNSRFSN